ncbi:unnamed protein product [Tilletia controversa]|uniref:Uncharacterized protein n=3 Tax=Tilletia TaxID=13289 RepID=A0A8X7SXT1_9BASI|nr:hypothetical protein CF336_g6648 [Tilletia laevis]KAE8188294.1 hypothetical protein CF328_g6645 [Tilletia controversa]KAE8248604.1 hypothetical protein A4X03_0g6739 [Tilletia caries]KAE8191686.1 hypothetical protein CF335_g6022 [Tilletia laevis]KAE8248271.1 hypothetical protein A4X06_0g3831 [Tilletia controversa]
MTSSSGGHNGAHSQIDGSIGTAATGIDTNMSSARRPLDLPFPRGTSTWNKLEKWVKFNPERLKAWEDLNPTLAAPNGSHSGRISKFHQNSTPSVRQEIEDWWPIYLVTAPHEERMTHFNHAHKVLLKMLFDMEQDYGVCSFAVLAHPDPDVKVGIVASEKSEDLLDGVVKNLNATSNASKFANLFGAATKSNPPESWTLATQRLNSMTEEDSTAAVSTTQKIRANIPSKLAAKDLVTALSGWVGSGMDFMSVQKGDAWREETKGKMVYKGVFTKLRDAGLYVEGWPIEARHMLAQDVVVTVQGSTTASTYTITSGSLHNTSKWNSGDVLAVQDALKARTMILKRIM